MQQLRDTCLKVSTQWRTGPRSNSRQRERKFDDVSALRHHTTPHENYKKTKLYPGPP